jgi:hypothetical protein
MIPPAKPILISNKSFLLRSAIAAGNVIPSAIKTAIWLVKITVPISFVVTLLVYFGVVGYVATFLNPVFSVMGLPGEASLVFITSLFLNIYSAIAVITQLPLTLREITILAVMCLIAHNLIVETAVQVKTGSKAWHIISLRLSWAIISGFVLNWILPSQMQGSTAVFVQGAATSFSEMLIVWGKSAFFLSVKILILVTVLMILQQLLKEFGVIKLLSRVLKPALKVFGLPQSTSFLWIVANILGLAFGSAVMVEEVKNGTISKRDADLLNYHIAISHSNLEDLLLFAAIGVPVLWILLPRLVIAALVVWARRLAIGRE